MDLKSTLNLPDPNKTIPMKANLPILEPSIQAEWSANSIYHQLLDARKDAETFVLHDGPPYTNSPIHMGTALNKILKDFVLKSRLIMGYRVPYVPGYDNHGLPIEQAVQKKFADQKIKPDGTQLRVACREHAAEFIDIQTEQFCRLGIFGLWEKPYRSMDFRFEAGILRVFKRLVEKGLVYKGLRPTLWSPTSRTALADTEIVYKEDHVSQAIHVAFEVIDGAGKLQPGTKAIIWTTTPWTIPANLALAFHPEFEYAEVEVDTTELTPENEGDWATGESPVYLVATELLERIAAKVGWTRYRILNRIVGAELEGLRFRHPALPRESVGVLADYVTAEDGTGVVHTAPSHGRDDFYTGQKYGLDVPNTVDEGGVLTDLTGEFAGTYFRKCDETVVNRLRELGALVHVEDWVHSYPYAERDGQPVIFRATEQWFIAIDPIRPAMLSAIEGVKWFPEVGQNRIEAMVKNRPDWCVSRQRPWGVGIPVFYGAKSRVPVLDPALIEHVASLVETGGSDIWFAKSATELLPAGYVHPETGETEFEKETDTLDVWFDSGSSSIVVLEGNTYPEWKEHWPADVYLEGSDQHRGWFNTSLILGVAVHGQAPYRSVVTHAFVTDEQGRKMSKRLGNVIDPVDACNEFGADVLRTWTASVKWEDDVPCGKNILKQAGETYRNLRNALRFLISSANQSEVNAAPTEAIDLWAVGAVAQLQERVLENYRNFEFGLVLSEIHDFSRDVLSRFYMDVIKDRLYCDAGSSSRRQSAEAACRIIAEKLIKLLAPILPHSAEESWRFLGHSDSVFLLPATLPEVSVDPELESSFAALLTVSNQVGLAFEPWKGTDGVKDRQDAMATITADADTIAKLATFGEDLPTFLRVGGVRLEEGVTGVTFEKSPYEKCARSRIRRADVSLVEIEGEMIPLTPRDRAVLGLA
jgi:isoleucyl-tRNA synthetase